MIIFKIVLLKHKPDLNGTYPIYIRFAKFKKQKYINTKLRCKINEWNEKTQKLNSQNINYKTANIMLDELLNKWSHKYYSMPIEKREEISLEDFINYEKINKNFEQSTYLFNLFEAKIERLKQINKIGTAKYYCDCLNSIKKHNNEKDIKLSEVNYEFLKKYEQALKVNGNVENGIANKMRSIRSIYNEAIELGLISREKYPFNQYKISTLKQEKKYRALSLDQIKMIKNLDTNIYQDLKLSKDLFLFSYYTGGMNFIDLINLKISDLYNDDSRVTYIRSKTKGVLDFKLNENAKKILEYYKRFNIGTKYLFPILLKDNLSPMQIFNRKHKCLSKLNKDLKIIASLCNINFDLTSYSARHSFASNLKQLGVATDQISEAMNHKDIKVTQVYLKKFENETIDNLMDKLL
jgi:site-specific recombinase XerD